MWNLLKARKNDTECRIVRDALDNASDTAELSSEQHTHLMECPECRGAADDISLTRSVLQEVPARVAEPGPWFVPRVMSAIAAREGELRQSLEAWAAVPRLAARLTWLSALALLLASTWLYGLPKSTPIASNGSAVDSLFDVPHASNVQDDAVIPLENGR